MDLGDWMNLKVDFYSRNGLTARPLTLMTAATNYFGYNASVHGRLELFLDSNPQMW